MTGIVERKVDRRSGSKWREVDDRIVEEAPLEIRLEGTPLAVVMRTPGHDTDLVLGFALTEGILLGPHEVAAIEALDEHRWNLRLAQGVTVDPARFQRNFYSTSSWTLPSHSSLFTGLFPVRHGATQENLRLANSFATLAETLRNAGFLTFGAFLFLWLIEYMGDWAGPTLGKFVTYLSVTKHIEEFAKGVIDTKDVIYYLSFIGFGLFLSKQSMESHRWRG